MKLIVLITLSTYAIKVISEPKLTTFFSESLSQWQPALLLDVSPDLPEEVFETIAPYQNTYFYSGTRNFSEQQQNYFQNYHCALSVSGFQNDDQILLI